MQDETVNTRLENIINYVTFEDDTSIIWPWAIPAEELLQRKEELLAVAEKMYLDEDGLCDTEEMYEELTRVFGLNPILVEENQPEEGMVTPGM